MNKQSKILFVIAVIVTATLITRQMIKISNINSEALGVTTEFMQSDSVFTGLFGRVEHFNVVRTDVSFEDSITSFTVDVLSSKGNEEVIFNLKETKYGGWIILDWKVMDN